VQNGSLTGLKEKNGISSDVTYFYSIVILMSKIHPQRKSASDKH